MAKIETIVVGAISIFLTFSILAVSPMTYFDTFKVEGTSAGSEAFEKSVLHANWDTRDVGGEIVKVIRLIATATDDQGEGPVTRIRVDRIEWIDGEQHTTLHGQLSTSESVFEIDSRLESARLEAEIDVCFEDNFNGIECTAIDDTILVDVEWEKTRELHEVVSSTKSELGEFGSISEVWNKLGVPAAPSGTIGGEEPEESGEGLIGVTKYSCRAEDVGLCRGVDDELPIFDIGGSETDRTKERRESADASARWDGEGEETVAISVDIRKINDEERTMQIQYERAILGTLIELGQINTEFDEDVFTINAAKNTATLSTQLDICFEEHIGTEQGIRCTEIDDTIDLEIHWKGMEENIRQTSSRIVFDFGDEGRSSTTSSNIFVPSIATGTIDGEELGESSSEGLSSGKSSCKASGEIGCDVDIEEG